MIVIRYEWRYGKRVREQRKELEREGGEQKCRKRSRHLLMGLYNDYKGLPLS